MILNHAAASPGLNLKNPVVGFDRAQAHLKQNSSDVGRFLCQLNPLYGELDAVADRNNSRLSLTVHPHRLSLMAVGQPAHDNTDVYRFSTDLPNSVKWSDVSAAMVGGALPYLASIQMQVRLINQMINAGYAESAWEIHTVIRDIEEDASAIVELIMGRRKSGPNSFNPLHKRQGNGRTVTRFGQLL